MPDEIGSASVSSERKQWAQDRVRSKKMAQGAFDFLGPHQRPAKGMDVDEVDAATFGAGCLRWLGRGYALTCGLSSDGGALNVKLLANGDVRSEWFTSAKDVEDFMSAIPGGKEADEG